jgi:hypothetical protein
MASMLNIGNIALNGVGSSRVFSCAQEYGNTIVLILQHVCSLSSLILRYLYVSEGEMGTSEKTV